MQSLCLAMDGLVYKKPNGNFFIAFISSQSNGHSWFYAVCL